ncbi:MAG TPA: acylphosphatase [Thermoanaerobaculia bacterium]
MIARKATVAGRVQGVGYRFFAERAAEDLGLRGWVRNLPDGNVESVVEGEEDAVSRYLACLREGPRMSRVTEVRVEEAAWTGFESFEITR